MKASQPFYARRSAVTTVIPIFTRILEGKEASIIETPDVRFRAPSSALTFAQTPRKDESYRSSVDP